LTIAGDPWNRQKQRRLGTNAGPPLLGLSRSAQNSIAKGTMFEGASGSCGFSAFALSG
jgi:hypothetical protein